MQAQQTQALQTINATQSLAAVQTLLKAGIGCITYLRNLLPADHFDESYFTSTSNNSLSFQSLHANGELTRQNTGGSGGGFRIMTIMRGLSNEADKLLSHLEYGIFDALERQYLKSFVLGIHLDNTDPNNVVETYTFNFQYHTIPGTKQTFPVMTLGLDNLSLQDNSETSDPVAKASMSGKAPTVLDVKKSVKAMLKRLIQATTHMESLPQRRFASFKIFYYDHTPDNYEPPTFQSGDVEKDGWYFTTHDRSEIPERLNLGSITSGYHSVSVNITSVTSYLPNSTADNDAVFTGTTARHQPHGLQPLTPIQEAKQRQELAELQAKDAKERIIAWSAESTETSSEHEIIVPSDHEDSFSSSGMRDAALKTDIPLGTRHNEGTIAPLLESQTPVFEGVLQIVPRNVREIQTSDTVHGNTQVIESPGPQTHISKNGRDASTSSTLPPSDFTQSSRRTASAVSEDMAVDLGPPAREEDIEMLDLETQPLEKNLETATEDIESFTTPVKHKSVEDIETTPQQKKAAKPVIDNGLRCECEIDIEVDALFCEGGCGCWYHVWCMGYHSIHDKRLPEAFKCFNCRLKADVLWEIIQDTDMCTQMISNFKILALFRRAIKVAEKHSVETQAAFTKVMGCDNENARALFKRLEKEGFISSESIEFDDFGLASRTRNTRGKSVKKAKPRKNLQRTHYIFVRAVTKSSEYANYFDPDETVEGKLLGIPEMRAQFIQVRKAIVGEHDALRQNSFTQIESQEVRREREEDGSELERPSKKAKISLTAALDLAE